MIILVTSTPVLLSSRAVFSLDYWAGHGCTGDQSISDDHILANHLLFGLSALHRGLTKHNIISFLWLPMICSGYIRI